MKTNVRVDGQKPNRRRQSLIHQGAKRRFGDCARKVTELTPGDLLRVASATEGPKGDLIAEQKSAKGR
jgi:hypothetical protein